MKLTNALRQLLLEKKGDSYDSGCVMLYFNFPQLKEIQDQIDPKDLYTKDGPRTYGLEDESHITLLFGIDPGVQLEDVVGILEEFTYGPCKVKDASLFENESYDVLKFDVSGPSIMETNKALTDALPYKNDFPDYHPHLTIGYIKSGLGKKYTELFDEKEYKLSPRYAVYSEASGKKHKITIKTTTK